MKKLKSYEGLEQEFVDIACELKDRFNINNKDLQDIIWDRC